MIAIRTIDLRNNFKKVSDIIKSGEKILVSRPHNENLIVLSEKEYNELEKLRRNAAYLNMLDNSFKELKDNKIVAKTIEELEAME